MSANEMKWQPIQTAPKDGTWILGAQEYPGKPANVVRWKNQIGWTMWAEMDPRDITHWMPLPAPPTTAEASNA